MNCIYDQKKPPCTYTFFLGEGCRWCKAKELMQVIYLTSNLTSEIVLDNKTKKEGE